MEYIGKHKVNGKEVYKHNNNHYYLEDGNYIKMEELSAQQKEMIDILHKYGEEIKFYTN
jgi:glyoxylate utilization-related uncharacterized protein